MAISTAVLLASACGNEPPLRVVPAGPRPAAPLAPITSAVPDPLVVAELAELGLEEIEPSLATKSTRSGAFQGPAPKVVAESDLPIDQSSPERALRGALDALARRDVAALARLRRTPRDHPQLTEDDAADAQRRFLSPAMAPTWKRISAALQAGAYEILSSSKDASGPTRVQVVLKVGGALGSYRLSLYKDGDAWFMS